MIPHNDPVQLRKQLRQRRHALSRSQQEQAALGLYHQLIQHPLFRRARHIGLYLANDGEIDPRFLLEAAQECEKQVYLPVIAGWPKTKMAFQPINTQTKWQKNRFGIQQPRWNPVLQRPSWALDLLCLPLVGFDRYGGRIGMGGGFYDRNLAIPAQHLHLTLPPLFGLAHQCQQVKRLPLQPWDIPMTAIVTDEQIFYCRNQ